MFFAGTQTHTKEGLRPIEEIKVGDYVLSKSVDCEDEHGIWVRDEMDDHAH